MFKNKKQVFPFSITVLIFREAFKNQYISNFVYQLLMQLIPVGMPHILHSCGGTDHLFLLLEQNFHYSGNFCLLLPPIFLHCLKQSLHAVEYDAVIIKQLSIKQYSLTDKVTLYRHATTLDMNTYTYALKLITTMK